MKKYIQITVAIILTATIFFTLGNSTNARFDWLNDVLNDAHGRVHDKGRTKTDELKVKLNNGLGDLIKDKVSPEVAEMEIKIVKEIEAYYDEKLEMVTETEGYLEVKGHLTIIEQQAIEHYKSELDKAFNDALGN